MPFNEVLVFVDSFVDSRDVVEAAVTLVIVVPLENEVDANETTETLVVVVVLLALVEAM